MSSDIEANKAAAAAAAEVAKKAAAAAEVAKKAADEIAAKIANEIANEVKVEIKYAEVAEADAKAEADKAAKAAEAAEAAGAAEAAEAAANEAKAAAEAAKAAANRAKIAFNSAKTAVDEGKTRAKNPDSQSERIKILIISLTGIFILAALVGISFWFFNYREDGFLDLICIYVFTIIELTLIISFISLTSLALYKYYKTKNLWTIDEEAELSNNKKIFNELALRHRTLSQLWFTISMAIIFGGLIYAVFHVMKVPCGYEWGFGKDGWGYEKEKNVWLDLVHFIPNLFLYSIFFVGYMWSLKNYKAHWHNFVTNEHRYASLVAINEIYKRNYDPEIQKQLDMQSAVVVLIPSETAYLEGEGKDEITAAERLLKIEEAIRELATQKEGKSK